MPSSGEMPQQNDYGDPGAMIENAIKKENPEVPSLPDVEHAGTMVPDEPKPRGERLEEMLIKQQETINRLSHDNDSLRKAVGALFLDLDRLTKRFKDDRQTLIDRGMLAVTDFDEEDRGKLFKKGYPGVEAPPEDKQQ